MRISDSDHREITALLKEIELCLPGHSRMIIILTATKLIAAMLCPAAPETKEEVLRELPKDIRNLMDEIESLRQKAFKEN
jgi:hypothetical protein